MMVVLEFNCNFDVMERGKQRIYLLCHLDWKSFFSFILLYIFNQDKIYVKNFRAGVWGAG